MSTFAFETASIPANYNYNEDSFRHGIQITPSSNVTATKLAVVQPATGAGSLGRIILALYSDNGSDVPNTLLGQTSIGSMSYGGSNLELTLTSSINLTANTKYWIVTIPADGHNSNLGFKYTGGGSTRYIRWESSWVQNPTSPPSNWTSLPNTISSVTGTAMGFYAVTEVTDTTAPTLSSSSPADNATAVSVNANIVLNFDESVDAETGNITIKKTSDNSTIETIDVTGAKVSGSGSSQITVNPSSTLESSTEYYVLIDASAFDDSSSNSYAGISSTTALSFTTTTESMTDPITDKDVVGSIDIQYQLAKSFITQSTSTVSNRLSYLRQNKDNQNLSRQNIKLDFGNAILTSLTNELLAKNNKSIIPDNWSSWSEGSLSSSKIGDSNNSSSGETDGQALAFGFDTKLKDNDLLGFAIQYGNSDTDVGSSGSKTDSENINFSVYRTRPLDNDNFIEGMFGVGLIESDLTRISGSNTLTGSRNGKQIFGSINYGKTLDKGDFNLTPVARLNLGYTELDAYSETGTDALSYGKQTIESISTP